MEKTVLRVKRRRWIRNGVLLMLLFWAMWSGVFTLDPRLAAIKEDMAFLLKHEAISPEEVQWALEQIEAKNLPVVEAFLAKRITHLKQTKTGPMQQAKE